jgi:hypothetical protein
MRGKRGCSYSHDHEDALAHAPEGVRCTWSCLRGDIQEELKNAPVLRHKPDQPGAAFIAAKR